LDLYPLEDDQVRQAVTRLLDEPQFAERAGHAAAEIAEMPLPEQVALALREFDQTTPG
jgi:UDP:flavonoid glycosyltransferase YjiC (YdhE family)